MESLPKPSSIVSESIGEHHSRIVISPCYPGYGTTLGNALRRVLLSSLPGAAVTAVKIKGVDHEFSTIPHVKQDVVEIILNLKGLRFMVHTDEPQEITLKVKGEKVVTGADFEKQSQVEVMNPDMVIAELTDKSADFEMKLRVGTGRGYVPVETREKEKMEVGYIAVDSIYTPIRNVNFKIEHVRVGQMTNFDKLILDILTDGTITPEAACKQATEILMDQFSGVMDGLNGTKKEVEEEKIEGEVEAPESEPVA